MLKEIIKQIDNKKEKLDKLVSIYGLASEKVIEQSKNLDTLISKYYSLENLKELD